MYVYDLVLFQFRFATCQMRICSEIQSERHSHLIRCKKCLFILFRGRLQPSRLVSCVCLFYSLYVCDLEKSTLIMLFMYVRICFFGDAVLIHTSRFTKSNAESKRDNDVECLCTKECNISTL